MHTYDLNSEFKIEKNKLSIGCLEQGIQKKKNLNKESKT